MPESVYERQSLKDRERVFRDRWEAGIELGKLLGELDLKSPVVLAIPSGGVPVGIEVAKMLDTDFGLLFARKLQIPGNTEAGFGACTIEGAVFLNKDLVEHLGLTDDQIEEAEEKTRQNLRHREEKFIKGGPRPDTSGRDVVIVDDGLASGYTMMAAIADAKKRGAKRVVVAAPTGSENTVSWLSRHTDMMAVPNIRAGRPFAVASAYELWYDLDDDEIIRLLKESE